MTANVRELRTLRATAAHRLRVEAVAGAVNAYAGEGAAILFQVSADEADGDGVVHRVACFATTSESSARRVLADLRAHGTAAGGYVLAAFDPREPTGWRVIP